MYLKYAKSTATNRVALVKTVLNEAYRLREIQENPCNFVKTPTKTKESSRNKVQEPFSKEEAQDFMAKLEGRFEEYVKGALKTLLAALAKTYGKGVFKRSEKAINSMIRKL